MNFGDTFWLFLKVTFITFISIDMAYIGWTRRQQWIAAYRDISWKLMPINLMIFVATITLSVWLYQLSPEVFGLSWLNIFGAQSGNVYIMAADVPYYGVLFCLLLFMVMPAVAEAEEHIFRKGTKTWKQGIKRSIIFGLVHMIVGIPLAAGIGLIIPGLFFTEMYFRGGTYLSTKAHFQHNLIVCILLLVLTLISNFAR